MSDKPKAMYGLTTNMFVTKKANGEALVVGGVGENDTRWVRILSYRAAQILRFQLARLLFPEKAEEMSAWTSTAPIRDASLPTVTSHATFEKMPEGIYELAGWSDRNVIWVAYLSEDDAQLFWTALEDAL